MWTRDFSESGRGVWGCLSNFCLFSLENRGGRVHGPSGRVRGPVRCPYFVLESPLQVKIVDFFFSRTRCLCSIYFRYNNHQFVLESQNSSIRYSSIR